MYDTYRHIYPCVLIYRKEMCEYNIEIILWERLEK